MTAFREADWERMPWHARRRILDKLEREIRDVRAKLGDANRDLDTAQQEAAAYRQTTTAAETLAAARAELRSVVIEAKRVRSGMSALDEARALLALITLDPVDVIAERRRQLDPRCDQPSCRKQAKVGSTRCGSHESGRRSDAGHTKAHGRQDAA